MDSADSHFPRPTATQKNDQPTDSANKTRKTITHELPFKNVQECQTQKRRKISFAVRIIIFNCGLRAEL